MHKAAIIIVHAPFKMVRKKIEEINRHTRVESYHTRTIRRYDNCVCELVRKIRHIEPFVTRNTRGQYMCTFRGGHEDLLVPGPIAPARLRLTWAAQMEWTPRDIPCARIEYILPQALRKISLFRSDLRGTLTFSAA